MGQMFLGRLLACLVILLSVGIPALAQSPGGFQAGQPLTAAELNAAFQKKTDYPFLTLPPLAFVSGRITCPTCTTSAASLTINQLVIGSGLQGEQSLGSLGTINQVLHGNAAGAPSFGAVVSADMNITATSCTNQFLTAISATGIGTCTTDMLASAQHANQGTATQVLHGNAAGNPSFGAVVTGDITDANVTYAKIQNLGALAVMGRSANSSGAVADIQATAASGAVLRENGSTIGFGTVASAGLASSLSLVTPNINIATGTSLALGGGSIGSDAFEVTGTTTHNGNVTIAGGNLHLTGVRSTIFTRGDNLTTDIGGLQFITNTNGTTMILTPTDASGVVVSPSKISLGGGGVFNSAIVGIDISGPLNAYGTVAQNSTGFTGAAGGQASFGADPGSGDGGAIWPSAVFRVGGTLANNVNPQFMHSIQTVVPAFPATIIANQSFRGASWIGVMNQDTYFGSVNALTIIASMSGRTPFTPTFTNGSANIAYAGAGTTVKVGNSLVFSGGSLPGGLFPGLYYFVVSVNSGVSFQVSATVGGGAITMSTGGSGTASLAGSQTEGIVVVAQNLCLGPGLTNCGQGQLIPAEFDLGAAGTSLGSSNSYLCDVQAPCHTNIWVANFDPTYAASWMFTSAAGNAGWNNGFRIRNVLASGYSVLIDNNTKISSVNAAGNGNVDGLLLDVSNVWNLGGGAAVSIPGALTILGSQQTTQGVLQLSNTAAGSFSTKVQSSNSSTAAWTLTLPTAAPAGNGYALTATTAGVATWTSLAGVSVTTFSAGTTGLTPNSATAGAVTLAGTLVPANGGTGLATLTAHAVMLGEGTSNVAFATIGTAGRMLLDQGAAADPAFTAMSGDATLAGSGALTLASVVTAGGPTGSATVAPIITYDAKGRLTTVSSATITPAVGSITGLGTGVATALAVNTGTSGSFVVNGGALGSPSSAGTIPAFTLGGTIAGGGNQINNVIIGTSTPLAGSFTSLNATSETITGSGEMLTVSSTASTATIKVIAVAASQQAGINLYGNNAIKWAILKNTDESFLIYDYANSVSAMALIPGANSVTFGYTTAATSKTAGSVIIAGGLAVGGTIYANIANAATTSAVCYNTSTGLFTYGGTLGTCTVSTLAAKNLKAHLTPREGFDIVMAMEPWRYDLKEGLPTYQPGEQIGFVAEYAAEVDKRLVAFNPNGTAAGFRYEQYTAYLTAAFQYLKADNDNLRAELRRIAK